MKEKINSAVLVALCLFVFGCGPKKQVDAGEYVGFFAGEQNGLQVLREFGKLKFRAAFVTREYLVCSGLYKNEPDGNNELKKKIDEVEDLYYLNLKIWSDEYKDPFYAGKTDAEVYAQRMGYANTNIIKDFKLQVNGELLDCRYVNFEPTHQISNAVTFALAFDKRPQGRENSTDVKLVYEDRLFGLSTIKFNFNADDINNIPSLNL